VKILYLSYYYLPHVGGGTWSTYHLSIRLSKNGHKVLLIVPNVKHNLSLCARSTLGLNDRNQSRVHRIPWFLIPRQLAPFVSSVCIFLEALRFGKEADIIVSQHHPHHLLASLSVVLGKILKVPVVLRANDIFLEMDEIDRDFRQSLVKWCIKLTNVLNEHFMKRASKCLVVHSDSKRALRSRLGTETLDSFVGLSYNGVDLSEFGECPTKTAAKKELHIGHDEKTILFVGRFSGQEYGIELLIRAMPTILEKIPDTSLVLVGDVLTQNQNSLVTLLGLEKKVRVYSSMPHREILNFISAADVCVGPLMATRAMPLKILEYMACGKPILTGVNSLCDDLVLENPDYVFVDPEPESISKAALGILQDEAYAKMLGSGMTESVKVFSWDIIAAELERALCEIRAERRHAQ
jgi:glycosyltransferase involved in cell wall biosynthesis